MAHAKLCKLVFIILVTFLKDYTVSSNYPDETGGYSIIVAFEDNHPEPVPNDSKELLIENIKTTFGTFSEKLWQTSRHLFYIKTVDILIPSSWNGINSSHSIYHSYNTATIRVSANADSAFAENPFPCGKPGSFVQLPTSFFNTSESSRYGPNWKALLNLWASYRWGVFEEHGYIGDLKYPYSYRDVSTGGEWLVTGCSDQPISGQYLNNESLSCSAEDTLNASLTCRFVPDQSVKATTSLMHFHWIDSIVNFCDETNHNKLSPNRQNDLCDHKSTWEVIRETRDFQIVTKPIALPSPIAFKIVQHSEKPSLYILLDKGTIQGPITLANHIPRAVLNFLNNGGLFDTVAAVGSFPGTEEPIKDEIDWSLVGENLDQFVDVIGELSLNRPLQRNFPQSIMAAVDKIKSKAHPNGVVMLVVKYGADLANFVNYPAESEIVNALNEQGIILNAIELRITNHSGHAHLSELARETGGIYTVVSNYGEAQTSLENVFWFLNKLLSEDYKELRKNYQTLLRTSITSGAITKFKVPKLSASQNKLGNVEAYFSTRDGSLSKTNFIVEGINSTSGSPTIIGDVFMRKIQDWLEDGSKWTYFLQVSFDKIESYSEVVIRTLCPLCHGTMLIRTNVMGDSEENITISIFTNVDNQTIDLRNEPIILFAKIFKSTTPVVDAQVVAYITDSDVQTTSNLYLIDDGEGSPDEEAFDGIYSGYFVPNRDGSYKISISVEGNNYFSLFSRSAGTSTFGNRISRRKQERLLPVDQEMGCRGASCDKTTLPDNFMRSTDFLTNFKVSNTANYSPEPTKISKLIVSHDNENVTLIWTAPVVPGKLFSVSSYEIRQASSKDDLIIDFENQQQVPGSSDKIPAAPGSLEQFKLMKPIVTTFYAICSVYRGRLSKISETQGIQITQDPPTTTTSTTTTTPSTTTTSTTNSEPTSSTTTTASTSSTTSSSTTTGSSSSTTGEPGSSTMPRTSTLPTVPPTEEPTEDKKPWAKTGGGIAIITIVVIIVVAAISIVVFYFWRVRGSSTGKINPPPQQHRSSIPL